MHFACPGVPLDAPGLGSPSLVIIPAFSLICAGMCLIVVAVVLGLC